MSKELATGILGQKSVKVTEENTAAAVGSGLLPVFSTPSLIALMECACAESVQDCFEDGRGTVGVALNVKHTAATPIGMTVRAESQLIEVDRRKLVFAVKAFDDAGEVGHGIHERFIIDNDRFMEKAKAKQTEN